MIVFGIFLVASLMFPLQVGAPDIFNPEVHDPIRIVGNEDMLNTASMEEWLGTGNEESPIVIKGLSIMSNSCAIYISNVDLHFRIEECVITAS
ncbi:MAG: hypothetical protein ACXACG_08210, partial [Candidatus Thorarchaeota archaeon]